MDANKVTCTYCQEGDEVWGFKFTGVQVGYTGNSLFLPADTGNPDYGYAFYWSSTAVGSYARYLNLSYNDGDYVSDWNSDDQSNEYRVRSVLND